MALPRLPVLDLCAWRVHVAECTRTGSHCCAVVVRWALQGTRKGAGLDTPLCVLVWGRSLGLLLPATGPCVDFRALFCISCYLDVPGARFSLNVSGSKVSPRIFSPLLASQNQT